MPSDRFYDEMDEAEDRWRNNERNRIKKLLEEDFSKMTLNEKVQFLLDKYINDEIRKIR